MSLKRSIPLSASDQGLLAEIEAALDRANDVYQRQRRPLKLAVFTRPAAGGRGWRSCPTS
jgi:hypothetical protein